MSVATGPTGATGSTGATGLQGAPGVSSFAYFSATGTQTVVPNGAVQFNQTPLPAILPTDIGFNAPSQIIVNTNGLYEITYYALPQNSNITLGVFVGGLEAPLSRYTAITSAGHVYGQTLVNIVSAPAVLTLRNVDPAQNANIGAGSLAGTVSASLLISKLS